MEDNITDLDMNLTKLEFYQIYDQIDQPTKIFA